MRRLPIAILILLMACATPEPTPVSRTTDPTRASMAEVVAALQVALPLALDEEAFNAPENQQALTAALERLRTVADALERHGLERDASFAFYSHSLAQDAAEISVRLREGRSEEARYFLNELVDTCVGCHSRLPGPSSSELGRTLYDAVDADHLPRTERIRLRIATRQFDEALADIEDLLRDDMVHPAQVDLGGFLEDYLRLAIRVRTNPQRAIGVLSDWQAKRDLPAYLDDLVSTWLVSLGELSSFDSPGNELAMARDLTQRARLLRRFPSDRRSVVFDLAVSGLLHAGLAGNALQGPERAEAYYLLGLAELHAAHLEWPAAPESYLEAAIREAPGSDPAREAYLLLEEEIVAGHTGSGGTHLPEAVESWLSELAALAGLSSP